MRFSIGAICCLLLALALSPATAAAPAADPQVHDVVLANGDALLSGLPTWSKGATPECPATVTLGAGQGVPGGSANPVAVVLNNSEAIAQVQFTVTDSPNFLTSNVCTTGQTGFACTATDDGTSVSIDFSGDSLPASANLEILQLLYDVEPAATAGPVALGLSNLVIMNVAGGACDVTGVDGSFEVLPVCGNGILENGEACDDGNNEGGDCCASDCTFEAAESACDDGIFCTAVDTCDGAGACLGSGETDCDDGDICTDDSCDATTDACLNVEDTTNDPSCEPSECGNGIVEGLEACDDGNTADGDCCAANCTFEAAESTCDDGIFCTAVDTCDGAGACLGSGETDCDDGDICTDDSCDATADACLNDFDVTNDPTCATCGDGVVEGDEQCDDGNTADGDCCAADCTFEAAESACDDGIFCTAVDTCDGAGACLGSGETDCDDGDICTDDSCDATADACLNVEDTTNDPSCEPSECGNGIVEGLEDCDDGNTADGDCCAADCTFEAAESACDDGIFCTAVDTCDGAGACIGSGETDCDDGDICTDDSCDATADACLNVEDTTNDPSCEPSECGNGIIEGLEDCDDGNTADGDCCAADCTFEAAESTCDDGIFCTAVDTCDGAGACLGSGETDCDDGDICTDDSCDAASDACLNDFDVTNDPTCATCGDGVIEGDEQCDDGNTADGDCCAADCTFEAAESTCDDGIFCTAVDTCDGAGACLGSGETDCDDGDICTDDSCDATADACLNVEDTTNDPSCEASECGNGIVEGLEDCDDGNTADGDCCAADCTFEAAESACDDGIFCTAVDTCDGAGACIGSGETDCDDGDICTDDSCDATADACLNVEDTTNDPSCEASECGNGIVEGLEDCDDGNTADGDCCAADCTFEAAESACDDGIFCTAVDTCDGAGACIGSGETDCDDGDICTDDSCDAASDACLNDFDVTNDPTCATCGDGVIEGDEQCDDGNTADGECCAADCTFEAAESTCDDGIFCTAVDACDGAGACIGSGETDCDDGDICTDDSCDATADACLNVEDTTNDPSCEASECGNGIVEGLEDCDDGNTADGDCCAADCTFEAAESTCDDGIFCTAVDTCDGAGACLGSGETDCDDGDICTDDSCDATADACLNVEDTTNDPSCEPAACGNGSLDDGETCDPPGDNAGMPNECRDDCTFCGDGVLDGGISGNELLTDGGMESWLEGRPEYWRLANAGGEVLRNTDLAKSGASSLELKGTQGGILRVYQEVQLQPGSTYRLDFWARTEVLLPLYTPRAKIKNMTRALWLSQDGNWVPQDGDALRGGHSEADVWQPFSATFTVPADFGADDVYRVQLWNSSTALQFSLFYDDASLLGPLTRMEQCDDGNNEAGDGCRADCTIEQCGDGILDPSEACDDGNNDDGNGCRSDCSAEVCGDGILDSGEACDDGNNDGGDGCRADCTIEVCGDGILDPPEQCDDGNQIDGDGCNSDCNFGECGDGVVDPGEDCDDGNRNDGDCCSSACLFDEAGASCEDGSFCTDEDSCDGAGTCLAGGERDCDDSDVCTDDSCDEDNDTCINDFDFNNDPVCERARPALSSTASCGFGLGTSEVCFDFAKGTDDGLPGGGDDITAIDWCVTWDTDAIDFNCDDNDQDGVPDDLAFFVDPGFATLVQCTPDNPACGLRISILDKALPFDVLPDDTLACATFSVLAGVADGDSPVPFGGTSASDTMGASIPLETMDESIALDSCCLADCNNDDQVDIADAVSVILELSDTDGNDFCDTDLAIPFDGAPCCDCNADRKIDIADAVCVVNGLGELQCPATAGSAPIAQSSIWLPPHVDVNAEDEDLRASVQPQSPNKSGLTLVQRQAGWSVVVPVIFQQEANDHRPGGRDEITAFSTCIDFDQKLLTLDTTDADLDGIPDAVGLQLPAGHAAFVKVDLSRSACELHLGVLDLTKPSMALPNGLLAEIEFEMIGRATGRGLWVRPGQPDTRSFADVEGVSQPVEIRAVSSKGD